MKRPTNKAIAKEGLKLAAFIILCLAGWLLNFLQFVWSPFAVAGIVIFYTAIFGYIAYLATRFTFWAVRTLISEEGGGTKKIIKKVVAREGLILIVVAVIALSFIGISQIYPRYPMASVEEHAPGEYAGFDVAFMEKCKGVTELRENIRSVGIITSLVIYLCYLLLSFTMWSIKRLSSAEIIRPKAKKRRK
jgi:hypothetical protein